MPQIEIQQVDITQLNIDAIVNAKTAERRSRPSLGFAAVGRPVQQAQCTREYMSILRSFSTPDRAT